MYFFTISRYFFEKIMTNVNLCAKLLHSFHKIGERKNERLHKAPYGKALGGFNCLVVDIKNNYCVFLYEKRC